MGAESSGTHCVTDLLIAAGCAGHSGKHVDWQITKRELEATDDKPWTATHPTDIQPWDKQPPSDDALIVWRFSMPHGEQWVDFVAVYNNLIQHGYRVQAVVVMRDQYAALRSQIKWHHSADFSSAAQRFNKALKYIFTQLDACNMSFTVASFESLIHYPNASAMLLEQLGLPALRQPFEFVDANKKWFSNAPPDDNAKKQLSTFDERAFPCVIEHTQSYYEHVAIGKERMSDCRVLICGLAHNIAHSLPNLIARLEKLGNAFNDYRVVLFENASKDGTSRMLQDWVSSNPRVTILSEPLPRPTWKSSTDPVRMRYMAHCRNRYLDHVISLSDKWDKVIVMDTDLPSGFSYQGVENSFGHDNWDMIGSNGLMLHPEAGQAAGRRLHYDAWAYRGINDATAQNIEKVNTLNLQRGEPLQPVNSCFGGLAIYTHAAFSCGARYAGDECEHVSFHSQIKAAGFTHLFLNPSQLVLYS